MENDKLAVKDDNSSVKSCKRDASPKAHSSSQECSSDPNCAICLDTLKNKSVTDTCFHTFCFPCLVKWSKIKSECPLCKQPFSCIYHNIRSVQDYDQYYVSNEAVSQRKTNGQNSQLVVSLERWDGIIHHCGTCEHSTAYRRPKTYSPYHPSFGPSNLPAASSSLSHQKRHYEASWGVVSGPSTSGLQATSTHSSSDDDECQIVYANSTASCPPEIIDLTGSSEVERTVSSDAVHHQKSSHPNHQVKKRRLQ